MPGELRRNQVFFLLGVSVALATATSITNTVKKTIRKPMLGPAEGEKGEPGERKTIEWTIEEDELFTCTLDY